MAKLVLRSGIRNCKVKKTEMGAISNEMRNLETMHNAKECCAQCFEGAIFRYVHIKFL